MFRITFDHLYRELARLLGLHPKRQRKRERERDDVRDHMHLPCVSRGCSMNHVYFQRRDKPRAAIRFETVQKRHDRASTRAGCCARKSRADPRISDQMLPASWLSVLPSPSLRGNYVRVPEICTELAFSSWDRYRSPFASHFVLSIIQKRVADYTEPTRREGTREERVAFSTLREVMDTCPSFKVPL